MAKEKEKEVGQDKMSVYNSMRKVPDTALKQIGAGRLKGMSDINPVWRIQTMTEVFGVCGIGWKYEITKQWNEAYGNEVKSFCNINLYIKVDGEWSDPIPGTGGSSFVAQERSGAYVSDECHKMALTDALSVAMKSLGMAADVYFAKGADLGTKYEQDAYIATQNAKAAPKPQPTPQPKPQPAQKPVQAQSVQTQVAQSIQQALAEINATTTIDQLRAIWFKYPQFNKDATFSGAMTARKDQLLNNGKK